MTTDPKDAEIADLVAELTRAPGWPTLARRAVDTIKALTAELREARMQVIASDGQAQMAYEAQQKSEAECERWKELYDNKASDYATLYDETVGTPCASIRWQHEREDLTAERDAALAQVADTVRKVWGRCEAMEDEAYAKLEGQIENDHERGFWTAQKMVAKSIRRSAEMPSNALAALSRRDAQMRAEGRKEGLREAAEHLKHHLTTGEDAALANIWIENILSAAEEEKGNG